MSHSISITIDKLSTHLKICDDLISDLTNEKERYKDILNFDEVIQKISNLKNKIASYEGITSSAEQINAILLEISNLQKNAINLRKSIQDQHNQLVLDIVKKSTIDITHCISKYGTMAIDTFKYLEKNDIPINNDTFTEALESIRQKDVLEEERNKIQRDCYDLIDKQEFNSEIKYKLKKEIRAAKTSQEISDIYPMIQSKIDENKKLHQYVNDLNKLLSQEGFKINKNVKPIYDLDEYSNIFVKYSMINSSNNKVAIIINSEGKIHYKLGNYIGHMCNKTSEKLIENLRDQGYSVTINSIKRDIDNNKPLEMEREMGQ